MSNFVPKQLITENNPGEKLRQKRQAKNLTIKDVSQTIKIRPEYLIALEEERWDQLPSGLYGKNFLKKYAQFLQLDPDELLTDFSNQYQEFKKLADPFSQKIISSRKLLVFPKIIKNIIIALLVLISFLYLMFYFRNIISTPSLKIIQPQQNLLTSSTVITIIGHTTPQAKVTLNHQNVLNDNQGYFSQVVNLKKGVNIITISAKKKYSQAKTINLEILAR